MVVVAVAALVLAWVADVEVVEVVDVVDVELDFEPESRTAKTPANITMTTMTATARVAVRDSPVRRFN